jgi:hypothetical protein
MDVHRVRSDVTFHRELIRILWQSNGERPFSHLQRGAPLFRTMAQAV